MFKMKWSKNDVKYFGLGSLVIISTSYALFKVTAKINRTVICALGDHYYPIPELTLKED